MIPPEFSRLVRPDTLGKDPRQMTLEADKGEREALARRFGLVGIDRLTADAALTRNGGEIVGSGTIRAKVVQSCVATGEPIEAKVEAPFEIVFRPHPDASDDEIELDEGELDVVFYDGASIDVGEAVAETLLLNLDPYPRAPGAEQALKEAGVKNEEEAGPFGALAGLRDKLKSD